MGRPLFYRHRPLTRTPFCTICRRHMYRLTSRVLLAGAASGLAAGLAFLAARDGMVSLFSSDPDVGGQPLGGVYLYGAVWGRPLGQGLDRHREQAQESR